MSDRRSEHPDRGKQLLELLTRATRLARELDEEASSGTGDRDEALSALQEMRRENVVLARRQVELAEEHDHLISLYVASRQLHSTLDYDEVLRIVQEIMIDLIGAERMAVFVLSDATGRLEPVAAEGCELSELPSFALGEGVVGAAASTGRIHRQSEASGDDPARPMVCIPLRVNDRPLGAVAIYGLLEHKHGIAPVDDALFGMMAETASTALLCARLYSQSERSRNTMHGFLKLLTE